MEGRKQHSDGIAYSGPPQDITAIDDTQINEQIGLSAEDAAGDVVLAWNTGTAASPVWATRTKYMAQGVIYPFRCDSVQGTGTTATKFLGWS